VHSQVGREVQKERHESELTFRRMRRPS
jgi:hypothetical protein